MYCTGCGSELPESFRFCPQCGASKAGAPPGNTASRLRSLTRPQETKKIAGVCAGIARYLQMDVTLVRILVAILAVYPPGLGLLFYIICWIVMPRDSYAPLHKMNATGEVSDMAS